MGRQMIDQILKVVVLLRGRENINHNKKFKDKISHPKIVK